MNRIGKMTIWLMSVVMVLGLIGIAEYRVQAETTSYSINKEEDETDIILKPTATPEPTATPAPTPVLTDTPEPTDTHEPVETIKPTDVPDDTDKPIEYVLGDVDGDGNIIAADALLVLKQAAKLSELDESGLLAANVTKDDVIDAADALQILKYAAKLIDSFE